MKRKLQLVFAAFILLASPLAAQLPGYVPSTNLLGWWDFSGNSNDLSGQNNNLTNSGAVLTTDRYGTANSAYSFSGSNQYLSNSTPGFNFGSGGDFTVSFWMKKTSQSYGIAVMSSTGTGGNFIWNFQTGTSGSFQFGTNKQGSSWSWAQTTYALNQWDHVVGTYSNGAMTLYINGVQTATSTYSNTSAVQTMLPFWVGRGHGGNYYTGDLDDLGVWDRVLTATEIDALYTGCNISVSSHPVNVAASSGGSAIFATSTADTAVTFQWQKSTGGTFQNLSNGGQYSGATTDSLTVNNLTLANDGEQYRCVIEENSTCADTSSAATLNVCGGINLQPSHQSVNAGSATYFAAGSSDPSATYQWQLATTGAFGNLYNNAVFSGVQTDTLKVAITAAINNGQKFRCIVKSGLCTDTTSEAILTVNGLSLDESFLAQIKMYPNPASEQLTIQMPASNKEITYSLVNQMGQQVANGQITGEKTTIDLRHLPNGIYVIRLGNSVSKMISIVK